ncbi:NAD(P)/FAD-dependent oxidoreductase [Ekhidna sp. To15]|uniref:NAD(P)/FAD-dependent oxidoreductase n=1 Tax=Ekhidna sp. To15 TaxID=3395267 RepID=UPI003F525878
MKIIVIGGGAAGFFTAINVAKKHANYQVIILEKTTKLLSKVKVSGGGRCNVTNERSKPSELVHYYPRGSKKLHQLFKRFTTSDMVDWLAARGVQTKAEADKRMFPITDSSQTIIDCFLNESKRLNVEIIHNQSLDILKQEGDRWKVITTTQTFEADKVIVATGSSPATWSVLQQTGLKITDVVPSLFTFNIKDERLEGLQGISFDNSKVKVVGSKLEETGPLLITHWGLSGPAVLKLSAWGAYELQAKNYEFEVMINFTGDLKQADFQKHLSQYIASNPKKKVVNYPLFDIPKRFWERITSLCNISAETPFAELSNKHINKLTEELIQGKYRVHGKSTFKEEFVTAGGVKLSEVNLETFECKRFPNLYLAGEVLDIDALTGGFNFQACWSAGWVISESI